MRNSETLHFFQRKILKLLQYDTGQRYSELYSHFEEEDRFPYHLKQLIKYELVEKVGSNYYLTAEGYQLAVNKVKSDFSPLEHKVPRVLLVCTDRKGKFLLKNYFVSTRDQEIKYGLPGMKLDFGDHPLSETVLFKLEEDFGIKGNLSYRCTQHAIYLDNNEEVLFDFVYLVFDITRTKVLLPQPGLSWHSREEIRTLPLQSYLIQDFVIDDLRESYTERVVKYQDFLVN